MDPINPLAGNPEALNQIPVPQPPKPKNFLVLIMSILLIVTVAIAGLFYFQIQKFSKELSKYQTQPSPTPSATPDETANWKIYANPKEGFSLSYPSDWKIVSDLDWSMSISLTTDPQKNFAVEYNVGSPYMIDKNTDQLSQIEAHKEYYLHSTSFSDNGGKQLSKQEIKIDGRRAIKYTLQPLSKTQPPGNPVVWIYIIQDSNHILRVTMYGSNLATQEKILSTFKFTDTSSGLVGTGNNCGGWDTSGEIICSCTGQLQKSACPTGAMCDSGVYTCSGQCGSCCYKGVFENTKYPKCQ